MSILPAENINADLEPPLIPIERLEHGMGIPIPNYQTAQSAGMDICAAIDQDIILQPGDRISVPSGFAIALPDGFEAQIRPRSGLALKFGLTVLNAPGTIDADYRGEIHILLINLGKERIRISRSMRIAQLVIGPVHRIQWLNTDQLNETTRGTGGFGSTGV